MLNRLAAVSGVFYPASKEELREALVQLHRDQYGVSGLSLGVNGMICPHAGYAFSGAVAAQGFSRCGDDRDYDVVVVMGPSHFVSFEGISIFGGDGYQTPLGVLNLSRELADEIERSSDKVGFLPRVHEREHSIEVILPFIQHRFGGSLPLLPLVFGEMTYSDCVAFAGVLFDTFRQIRPLVIASSDFSHFYSYEQAVKMDHDALDVIKVGDSEQLVSRSAAGDIQMCGLRPIVVLLEWLKKRGHIRSEVCGYQNSGDVTGDKSSVVGYSSMVFC